MTLISSAESGWMASPPAVPRYGARAAVVRAFYKSKILPKQQGEDGSHLFLDAPDICGEVFCLGQLRQHCQL
jgi:hypothetical protein